MGCYAINGDRAKLRLLSVKVSPFVMLLLVVNAAVKSTFPAVVESHTDTCESVSLPLRGRPDSCSLRRAGARLPATAG